MSQEHILVVDDNEMVTQMMRMLLTRLGYAVTLKTSPIEALSWLQIPGNLPDMIISDVIMPEMSGQEFIQRVRSDPLAAHLPIILLTGNKDMDEKIAGFEAGADDYLVKPVDPTELDLRVKALLARSRAPSIQHHTQSQAKVITVFSLRGGVGTTSTALNLSVALTQLWGTEVPLIDLSLKSGHCALMLNLKPKYTLSFLADLDTPTVDVDTIESLLLRHETGVKVLPAPHHPAEAELVTPVVLDRVWPYLRAAYPFIIIDGGSQLTESILTALERSQSIVLMLTPDLASLKATVDTIRLFEQLGYDDSAEILPVINWTFPKDGLSQKSIESALKRPIAEVIPHNPTFVRAINSGQPFFTANPKSKVSQVIANLASQLSATEMDVESETDETTVQQAPELSNLTHKLAPIT
jgi:pilus assembly protein CpaE